MVSIILLKPQVARKRSSLFKNKERLLRSRKEIDRQNVAFAEKSFPPLDLGQFETSNPKKFTVFLKFDESTSCRACDSLKDSTNVMKKLPSHQQIFIFILFAGKSIDNG
jgi:hypothetical protein